MKKNSLSRDRALFVIESPFQLFCAFEAIHHFQIQSADLLILTNSHPHNAVQIENVLNKKDFAIFEGVKSFSVSNGYRAYLNSVIFILKLKFKNYRYKYVFIGHYDCGYMRVLGANLSDSKTVVLDDGANTLFLEKQISKPKSIDSNFRDVILKLFGLKNNLVLMGSSFFSFFPMMSDRFGNWIQHRFEFINRVLENEKQVGSHILLLGSPFVEKNMLSVENYHLYLEKFRQMFPVLNITYAPHRAETKENLRTIELKFRFHIMDNSLPIELSLSQQAYLPLSIASFGSMALLTLPKIFRRTEYITLKIDTNKFPSKYRENYRELYSHLEKLNESKIVLL